MPPQESEPDGHYGKWKMEDCNLGTTRVSRVGFGSLPKQSSLNQTRLCERIAGRLPATAGWQPALPNPKTEKGNAGPRFTRDPAFSRCQQSNKD